MIGTLQWRHNGRDGVSDHQPHDCLLNRLFRRRSQKTSKLRVSGLCTRNSPVTDEFPVQRASNAENVSISWRHRDIPGERGHYLGCRYRVSPGHQQSPSVSINHWPNHHWPRPIFTRWRSHWTTLWLHEEQATGLDAWASRVKCPARFVSHLHEICIYIWVVYSFCLFCCLFIVVTWWYVWCIEWASGNQEEVQACLVTLWLFIISCYSLNKTILGLSCSWFENNPYFHKYSTDFHV